MDFSNIILVEKVKKSGLCIFQIISNTGKTL